MEILSILSVLKNNLIGKTIPVWTNGIIMNGHKENTVFCLKTNGVTCPTIVQCCVEDVIIDNYGKFFLKIIYLKTMKEYTILIHQN